jgi:diadenosine tetraphosphatase ApaH/serine/threonine PP2A family protein phosphatase
VPERTLFVGDVHACADELRELLDRTVPRRVVLLGDLFNKGPDAIGTWRLVQEVAAESVLGNHDAWVLAHGHGPAETRAFLSRLPLAIEGPGWIAIHAGLHPGRGLEGTTRQHALTLRRWPDDTDSRHPFWWELYRGPDLVVYGHDAVRGLVDRRPHTLGLDTGCVYGGALTGYLMEEDRLVSVPARRVYHDVRT